MSANMPVDDQADAGALGGRLAILDPARLTQHDQRVLYERFEAVQSPWAAKAGFEIQLAGRAAHRAVQRASTGAENPLAVHGLGTGPPKTLGPERRGPPSRHPRGRGDLARRLRTVAHTAVAFAAGLSDAAIEVIKTHRAPDGVSDCALAAYRLVGALMRDHDVPDEIYARAVASLGEDGVVAAVQIAGHYVTVCALLRAFHVPAPSA